MRSTMRLSLSVGLCLVLVSSVMAQQGGRRPGGQGGGGFGGGFGGTLQLVGIEQVQKELKITDDQKTKLTAIIDENRQEMTRAFGGRGGGNNNTSREDRQKAFEEFQKKGEEYAKKAEALLNADQTKRLKEIRVQMAGINALGQPEVAKELKISEEQAGQLKTIRDEANKQRQELGGFGGNGGTRLTEEERAKNREKREQLDKDTAEESLGILSDEQKAQFEKLKGAKFELDRSQLFRRPGGEGGGRRGNNNNNDKKA